MRLIRDIVFFETSVLKKVRILHYLHNNNTALIPKFQNIAVVYYVIRVPKVPFRFFDKLKKEIRNKVLICVSILKLGHKI